MAEVDLINRDPNNINNHLQVSILTAFFFIKITNISFSIKKINALNNMKKMFKLK